MTLADKRRAAQAARKELTDVREITKGHILERLERRSGPESNRFYEDHRRFNSTDWAATFYSSPVHYVGPVPSPDNAEGDSGGYTNDDHDPQLPRTGLDARRR